MYLRPTYLLNKYRHAYTCEKRFTRVLKISTTLLMNDTLKMLSWISMYKSSRMYSCLYYTQYILCIVYTTCALQYCYRNTQTHTHAHIRMAYILAKVQRKITSGVATFDSRPGTNVYNNIMQIIPCRANKNKSSSVINNRNCKRFDHCLR